MAESKTSIIACGLESGMRSALEQMLEGVFPTNIQLVRPQMKDALDEYAQDHVPRGSFLRAVLCNDLKTAVAQADHENLVTLPAIVSYIYNELPIECWGSPEKYVAWITRPDREAAL